MKKFLGVLLACAVVLSLAACGDEAKPKASAVAPTQAAPTVQVVEGEPLAQLTDVSVYIPVTGQHRALPDLPDYVYSEGGSVNYREKLGRYGQQYHVLQETDAAAFVTFLQALEKDGWQQYSSNMIAGTNLFATYTKDEKSLYCYYLSSKNRTCIISSPNQYLEVRQQDNDYEAVCTTQLTQIKLLCESWPGGMSYLLRLSDGRFVIVDGGYNEKNFQEAQRLYALMQEQNVLPKITVAAWIITHPHKDHLGAASDFLRTYNSAQVDIQKMIFNFPTDEELLAVDEQIVKDTSDPSKMPTFLMGLEELWPQLPVTVCHTGQVYHFADAKIEILHTHEDFYPQGLYMQSQDPVNGASVVFSVEVGGQKTLFLADSAKDCSADLVTMWGDYLKSDIMQASHHGLNGGSVPLYEKVDPQVVMVPMVASYMPKILAQKHSLWIWNNESGNIKEVILSDWEQRVLALPYQVTDTTPYFASGDQDPWAGLESQYRKD